MSAANVHFVRFDVARHRPHFCRVRPLPEPVVVECPFSTPSPLWVEKQEFVDQVGSEMVGVVVFLQFAFKHTRSVRRVEIDTLGFQGFDFRKKNPAWIAIVRKTAAEFKHFGILIQLRVSSHDGPVRKQFGDHAAHAPHVDSGIVFRRAQKEFRRAVPAGDDLVGIFAVRVLNVQGPSETKVGDFEEARVGNEDICRLDITVDDVVLWVLVS